MRPARRKLELFSDSNTDSKKTEDAYAKLMQRYKGKTVARSEGTMKSA